MTTKTKKKNTPVFSLITLILLILTATSAFAFNTAYTNVGYDKQSDYFSTTNLHVTGNAVTINNFLTLTGTIPLSTDLTGDGQNLIVFMDSNNYIYVQNYTGSTFSNLANYNIGNITRSLRTLRYTPGIIDYDNDGSQEIITLNRTDIIILNYTHASGLVLEKNITLPGNVTSGSAGTDYFIIKCTKTGLPNSIAACFTLTTNYTGTAVQTMMLMIDLTNNTVQEKTLFTNHLTPDYTQNRNVFLLDINNDGQQEAIVGVNDVNNGQLWINYTTINNDDTITMHSLYKLTVTNGYYFSDVGIGNYDGIPSNGLEVGMFYRSGANQYSAKIVDRTGTVLTTTPVTATDVQYTGSIPRLNLVSSSGSNQMCALVTNASNLPANNGDTDLLCFSTSTQTDTKIESTGYQATLNGQWSFGSINSTDAVITGGFGAQYLTSLINFGAYTHAAVFDYKNNGEAIVLLSNSTSIAIYDSLYSNALPVITGYVVGTGNPACLNVIQKYTLTLTDAENDGVTCSTETQYYNGTSKYNTTNQTLQAPNSFTFLETLNEVGIFKVLFKCTDAYHTTPTSNEYLMTVANSSCNLQDQNPAIITSTTNTSIAASADFQAQTESFWTGLGLAARAARNAVALVIALIIAVLVYMKTSSGMMSVSSIPVVLLISYFIGLATLFPIIVMILITVAWLVYTVIGGKNSAGG